jgi:hypothetical protein
MSIRDDPVFQFAPSINPPAGYPYAARQKKRMVQIEGHVALWASLPAARWTLRRRGLHTVEIVDIRRLRTSFPTGPYMAISPPPFCHMVDPVDGGVIRN